MSPNFPKKTNTLPKSKKVVLHLGSDTEEDDDISETYKPLIKENPKEKTFVVTLIPPQHFREIVSREVHNIEELKTFYVPPLRGSSGPGSFFSSIKKRTSMSMGISMKM